MALYINRQTEEYRDIEAPAIKQRTTRRGVSSVRYEKQSADEPHLFGTTGKVLAYPRKTYRRQSKWKAKRTHPSSRLRRWEEDQFLFATGGTRKRRSHLCLSAYETFREAFYWTAAKQDRISQHRQLPNA